MVLTELKGVELPKFSYTHTCHRVLVDGCEQRAVEFDFSCFCCCYRSWKFASDFRALWLMRFRRLHQNKSQRTLESEKRFIDKLKAWDGSHLVASLCTCQIVYFSYDTVYQIEWWFSWCAITLKQIGSQTKHVKPECKTMEMGCDLYAMLDFILCWSQNDNFSK